MYLIILGIFPIMVSSQVLVTDLIDAVNNEGKLIKYLEKESIDTWADALEKIDMKIVSITSPIFSLLEKISSKSKKDIVLS